MLVDHFASATEAKETTFANISSIECPAKPSDYRCPQLLSLTKEQLSKKICEYETVLTGSASLIPDTEKAQTRCGSMNVDGTSFKNEEDIVEVYRKIAIVFGKDCQSKSILEKENAMNRVGDGKQKQDSNEKFHLLIKASIPASTKFVLADGANMDLLSASVISREEIDSILKQCPKV